MNILSIPSIPMREHVASVSVVNSMPYERGPMQTLTCHHEPSSILEANELSVCGRQQCHMFELQLPLDHWHCLMVVFLLPQGSILI